MKLSVKPMINGLKKSTRKIARVLHKKAPDILIATGIVTGVATTATACYATTKAVPKYKGMRDIVKELKESDPSMSPETKKEIRATKLGTAADIAKDYAGSAALGLVSVSSVLASHHIIKQRNVALAAAYVTLDQGFKNYRKNVVEELGEDADTKFLLGAKEFTEVNPETGEVTKSLCAKEDPNLTSDYACYFDNNSCMYDDNHEFNMMFLRAKQHYANDKLASYGYLFLNDVYTDLGLPKTKMGQVVGWIYKPSNREQIGDGHVDFRIKVVRWADEYGHVHPKIVLDFNVDGPIIDDFDEN